LFTKWALIGVEHKENRVRARSLLVLTSQNLRQNGSQLLVQCTKWALIGVEHKENRVRARSLLVLTSQNLRQNGSQLLVQCNKSFHP